MRSLGTFCRQQIGSRYDHQKQGDPLYPQNYEKSFVDVSDSVSHFELRCIDEEVWNVGIDGPFHKLRYLHIKFLSYLRDI